jgi:drug/metabolite transporter (DMT)-like permease
VKRPTPATRSPVRGSDSILIVSGALITGASSTLMHLSGTSGPTVAFFRCLYALPVLIFLTGREIRRRGTMEWRQVAVGAVAGVFLALDLILWFDSIQDLGAGLATVVQDTQVVFVAAGAWLILRSRPSRRLLTLIPILLAGICLISGVLGSPSEQTAPLTGTALGIASAIAYAGFLLLMGWKPHRRKNCNATFLTSVTIAAGGTALLAGVGGSGIHFQPAWPSAAWLILLALSTQVFGWLVISAAMSRVTSVQASIALLFQPVAAVFFAWAFLAEKPAPTQLIGVATVIIATAAAVRVESREADQSAHIAVASVLGATEEDPHKDGAYPRPPRFTLK